MRSRINGFFIFVVVAVGVAVGVYFATQLGDGTSVAQERPQKPPATPGGVIQGMVGPSGTPTGPWEVPTCPPLTPTPTPPPPGESGPTTSGEAVPPPWPCIPADQPPPPPDAPPSRPEPPFPAEELAEAQECYRILREGGDCPGVIDLSKPIPYELPLNVGGITIHLPVGSTHHTHHIYPLAGISEPGPTMLHVIERGHSRVSIDPVTGQIVEWDVAPEDEGDFRSLILEPLQES